MRQDNVTRIKYLISTKMVDYDSQFSICDCWNHLMNCHSGKDQPEQVDCQVKLQQHKGMYLTIRETTNTDEEDVVTNKSCRCNQCHRTTNLHLPAFDVGVWGTALQHLAFNLYVLADFPDTGAISGLSAPPMKPGLVIITNSSDSAVSLSPLGAFLFSCI